MGFGWNGLMRISARVRNILRSSFRVELRDENRLRLEFHHGFGLCQTNKRIEILLKRRGDVYL